ncbi:beta-propeller fold lactonase family protein, partial [Nocardia brasiliensis]|uniref:beta-propeller fold lactonase family protein n=1 Tax=Nocardia brasiliensis TaxID=37326 RepID=UPI002456B54E
MASVVDVSGSVMDVGGSGRVVVACRGGGVGVLYIAGKNVTSGQKLTGVEHVNGGAEGVGFTSDGALGFVAGEPEGKGEQGVIWVLQVSPEAGGTANNGLGVSVAAGLPINVGWSPRWVGVEPGDKRVWVANFGGGGQDHAKADIEAEGSVSVIAVADVHKQTSTTAVSVPVGPNPISIGFTGRKGPAGWMRGFVANHGASSVSVVDPDDLDRKKVLTVGVGAHPSQVLASRDGSRMYVANSADTTVSVIEVPEKPPTIADGYVVRTVSVGPNPRAMAISPSGRWVCVTCEGNSTVAVLDTHTDAKGLKDTVVAEVAVGVCPWQVAADPTVDGRFYVLDYADATIDVVDITEIDNIAHAQTIATMSVPDTPTGITFSPDGTRAYVTHNTLDEISVINTGLIIKTTTLPIPSSSVTALARGMTIDPTGKRLYLTTDTLGVLAIATPTSAETALHITPYGYEKTLTGLACHPHENQLYIVSGRGTLDIVDITDVGPDDKPKEARPTTTLTIAGNNGDETRSAVEAQHPCVTSNDLLVIPDQTGGQFTLTTGSIASGSSITRTTGAGGPHHSVYSPATHLTAISNPADNTVTLHVPVHVQPTPTLNLPTNINPTYSPTHITGLTAVSLPTHSKPASISYVDNTLYITDPANQRIHTYTTNSGAPAPATDHNCAEIWPPGLLATTYDGKHLYATSKENSGIKHFTVASDGKLTDCAFYSSDLALTSISSTADNKALLAATVGGKIVGFALANDGSIATSYSAVTPSDLPALACISCSPASPRVCCAIATTYKELYVLDWDNTNHKLTVTAKIAINQWKPRPSTAMPALAMSHDGNTVYAIDDSNNIHVIGIDDVHAPKYREIETSDNAYPTALTALPDVLVVGTANANGKGAIEIIDITKGFSTLIFGKEKFHPNKADIIEIKQIGNHVFIQYRDSISVFDPTGKELGGLKYAKEVLFRAMAIEISSNRLYADVLYPDQECAYGWMHLENLNSTKTDMDGYQYHKAKDLAVGKQVVWEPKASPLMDVNYMYPYLDNEYVMNGDNDEIGEHFGIKLHSIARFGVGYVAADVSGKVFTLHEASSSTTNGSATFLWESPGDPIKRVKLNSDASKTFWAISASRLYLVQVDKGSATELESISHPSKDVTITDIAQNYGSDNGDRFCLLSTGELQLLQHVTANRASLPLLSPAGSVCGDNSHIYFSTSAANKIFDFNYSVTPMSLTSGVGGYEGGLKWQADSSCGVGGWLFCVDVDGRMLRALSRGSGGGLVDN